MPSLTTPLGLVKHAVFVEQALFHSRVAGRSRADVGVPDNSDDSFQLRDDDNIESVQSAFKQASVRSREIAAAHPDLEEQYPWRVGSVTPGFIYTHMIQEYARHAGHGDILLEQIRAARLITALAQGWQGSASTGRCSAARDQLGKGGGQPSQTTP